MSKRKEIEVDEDLIKSMMAGDIPRLEREPVKEKKKEAGEKDFLIAEGEKTSNNTVQKQSKEKTTRQNNSGDYSLIFLKKGSGTKRQTYIDAGLYDKISRLLSIISKDISVPNFLSNVLEQHLKEHKEEINELYRNNSGLII